MLEFHADDYGLFQAQSRRILDCFREGCLNGVSIMPNGSYLAEGMKELRDLGKQTALTVHLNLVEGGCLSPKEKVADLVDEKGNFAVSFGKLLLMSYVPFQRKRYREQIREELKNQIDAVRPYLDPDHIRLDSHCHYHMLPVVFDSMMDVIREEKLPVTYIRMPRENLSFYWKHRKELEHFRWINVIKALCLNVLYRRNYLHSSRFLKTLDRAQLMGVMLSGIMSYQNVTSILPDVRKKAERLGQNVELIFHPGAVYEKEDWNRLTDPGDRAFLSSEFRKTEAQALGLLREQDDGTAQGAV